MSMILEVLRRRAVSLLTAGCLLLAVASAFDFVGSSNLIPREGRTIQPVGHGDYALQYYYAVLGSGFLHQGGVPYGYDPNFLSGYVKTPAYYPSSLPFEFVMWFLRDLPPALAFNWTVFALLAMAPLLLFGAALNFGLAPRERLALALLMLLPPQALEPELWLYTIMQASGMVAFIFGCYLSIFMVSLAYRFLVDGKWSATIPLAVSASLLFPVHPTTPIFTVVPLAVLYLGTLRRLTLRQHLAMWAIAATAVAMLWPWLQGYLLFNHYSDLHAFDQEEAKHHFEAAGGSLLGPLSSFLDSTSLVSRLPLVLGPLGLVAWWRSDHRHRLAVFGSQIAAMTAVAYYGDRFGLGATAPGRFVLPLGLYLLLPTSVAAVQVADAGLGWLRSLVPPRHRQLAFVAVLLLSPGLVDFVLPAGSRTRASLPAMQMNSGYAAQPAPFAEWLAENTDDAGRILHEETSRFSYQYFGTYLMSLMPLHMNRQFANGPAPFPLLQQNVLRFMAGTLQEKPLKDVDPAEVRTLLERYNVHWVLVWSEEAKAYFSAQPTMATLRSSFDKFDLYQVDAPWGYLAKGSGNVTAGPNFLAVSGAVPDGDEVVLRYHWDGNMHVAAPMELFPVEVPGDPVPFVGVRHAEPSFQIEFRY